MKTYNRESWLNEMKDLMQSKFNECGYEYPQKVQIAAGFCTKKTAIGQCITSTDEKETCNIFIDPSRGYSTDVARILCHELIHACVGNDKGHGKAFKDACRKLGLEPTKHTKATVEFIKWVRPLIDKIGKYPHEKVNRVGGGRSDQAMLKIIRCPLCNFWLRIKVEFLLGPRVECPYCKDQPLLTKEER